MASSTILESSDLTLLLLSSSISALDAQTVATKNSQVQLQEAIENLAEYLRVVADHEEPYDIAASVRKLTDCQRRMLHVSARLSVVTNRLGDLQRQIARETHQHKILVKGNPPEKPAQ